MKAIIYRPDIDALRGIAVLLVVIFHAFPELMPGGFIGVDVFFVISGYLITSIIIHSIESKNFSLKDFYSRRVRRLFPALILVLSTTLLLGWLVLFPDELKQLGDHAAHSAIYVLNFILIGEVGYFDVDAIYKPLVHLWTLAIEEQYYIFWPILLLLTLKQKKIVAIFFISLILIASFFANIYYINTYQETVYFHTLTRVWQLAIGSLLAIIVVNKQFVERKLIVVIGLFLILLSAFLLTDKSIYPSWLALLPTIGAAFVIFGNIQLSNWGGLLGIGLISYPLYLWHWVLISFTTIYLGNKPTDNTVMIAVVIVSVFLSWVTYKYIEPIRYSKKTSTTGFLFAALIIVGIVGWYFKDNDGLPDRGHLDYLGKFNIEFTRTPATDSVCEQYAKHNLKETRLFDYCRASNLGMEKYIAVIGDSHAHVSYPGIVEVAKKNGYGTILLANSSCPVLVGFEWGKNKKEIADCKVKITQIMNIIKSDDRINKVFVATRGPVYIHGEVDGEFSDDSVNKSLSKRENDRQTYTYYAQGLRNTFKKLKESKHINNIYYFLENPELDFLPKEVVIRPFDKWELSSQKSTMSLELHLKRMSSYRSSVNQAKKGLDITVIDPIDCMCDQDRCYSYKNNNFLYADDDHFSVFGSNYVAERMKDILFNDRSN